MKIKYFASVLLLIIFCSVYGSTQSYPGIILFGVEYRGYGLRIDSVEVGQQIITNDGNTNVFKIKGIDQEKYVALRVGQSYAILKSTKINGADEEEALIEHYVLDYKRRLEDEKLEIEQQIKYVEDNPWPYKILFRGNHYTKTNFEDTDQCISSDWNADKLGETTEEIMTFEVAYPKNYVWKEGESLHPKGSAIYAIKNIDPKYYISVDGYLYANDAKHNRKIEKKLKKKSQETYRIMSEERAMYRLEFILTFEKFTPNTVRELVELMYPNPNKESVENELLKINSIYLDVHNYQKWNEQNITNGFFEINFKTSSTDNNGFYPEAASSGILELHNFIETNKDVMKFRVVRIQERHLFSALFSELIDNGIMNKAKTMTAEQFAEWCANEKDRANQNSLIIRFDKDRYKQINFDEVPDSTKKAIHYIIATSIY